MIDLHIVELASDPQLIPGIYNTCDQWCDYCVATERCLSFKIHRGRVTFEGRNLEDALFGSMRRLCDCYEAEGLEPPEDMRRLLAGVETSARNRRTREGHQNRPGCGAHGLILRALMRLRIPHPLRHDRTVIPRAMAPAPAPHFEITVTACVNGTSSGCTRSFGRMNSAPAAGVGTDGTSTV